MHASMGWKTDAGKRLAAFKWLLPVLIIAMALLVPRAARADEITVAGVTAGGFNGDTPAATDTIYGLTYTNSSFDVDTTGGFAAIDDPASSPNLENLGSFTLSGYPYPYAGNTFTLDVTFTVPTGIVGGNTSEFTAILVGRFTQVNRDIGVSFDNASESYTFSNDIGSGSFTLVVNSLQIMAGQTAALTGYITGGEDPANIPDTAPEASTLLLSGLGLGSLLLLRRKMGAVGASAVGIQ